MHILTSGSGLHKQFDISADLQLKEINWKCIVTCYISCGSSVHKECRHVILPVEGTFISLGVVAGLDCFADHDDALL